MTDEHDELRARLRAADPASSLPRSDPDRVARLLEDTMSHSDSPHSDARESHAGGTRQRSPLTWLVAAAAAVIIAGVGAFALMNGGDDSGSEVAGPDPSGSTSESTATTTELTAPGAEATSGRCLPPTADLLADADVAFDGTVEQIEDGLVTLRATHWYAGEPTDLVTVRGPSEELQQLLVAVDFQDGGRYLVAASKRGQVMVCGFSSDFSPQLQRLYDQAFGQ